MSEECRKKIFVLFLGRSAQEDVEDVEQNDEVIEEEVVTNPPEPGEILYFDYHVFCS